MANETNQIHNVVRTYQRAIHLPPSTRQDAEQAGHVKEDQQGTGSAVCGGACPAPQTGTDTKKKSASPQASASLFI